MGHPRRMRPAPEPRNRIPPQTVPSQTAAPVQQEHREQHESPAPGVRCALSSPAECDALRPTLLPAAGLTRYSVQWSPAARRIRLSAGTHSMDYALHAPFVLGLYRDHKSFAAYRDYFFLQSIAFRHPPQITLQRLMDRAFLFFNLSPNARELRRGTVIECAIGKYLVEKAAQEACEVSNAR